MWPFSRHTEDRQAVGGYTAIISALIEAQAAGTTQQASATAATEAVAGALSRAFADARVDGPADIAEALSPRTLAQIGRDLVRVGESLHVIRMSGGRLHLFPRVHLVLARQRGPGRLDLHGHGLRAVRFFDMATSSIVSDLLDMGIADRPAISRPVAWNMGG